MGRSPCCSKEGLNRGLWTAAEDKILTDYIKDHGEGRWRNLPKKAGLKRCGKSCRLRWLNYLRPDIKRGNISHDEEELIIRLHKLLGNRWSLIAGRLPGRTDNEIKNYWNTKLGKKATSSTHSHSKQNSNEKNKKKIETPSMAIANTDTEFKNEPHLVRTQAVMRCSMTSPQPQNTEPIDTNTVAAQAMVKDMTFTPHEECHPSDFMLDVNMGELCLSDLLNSDFSGLLFPEEMLEDWTVCENIVQPNEEYSNHHDHAFASFLGSGENWLAEEEKLINGLDALLGPTSV